MNNRSLESIFDFIRKNSVEDIANFDIKDLWKEEMKEYTEKKMQEILSSTYKIGNLTPLKKLCCYKICANAENFKIDCDVSLFSMVIFRLAFPISGTHLELQPECHNKYQLTGLNFICVGDTMNSYATVTRRYIKKYWNPNFSYLIDGKYKPEYRMVSSDNPFEAIILEHYEEIDKVLPNYINEFLKVVHTIGNMIPVPKVCFNLPRYQKTHDYWDVTLNGISNGDFKKIIGNSIHPPIPAEENVKNCQEWFSNYGGWEDFVEKTFMSAFLENGIPVKLYKEGYEKFYQKVTNMIKERGKEIAIKTKEIVNQYSNEELLEIYFKDANI